MNKIKFLLFSVITLCSLNTYTYDSMYVYETCKLMDRMQIGEIEQTLIAKNSLTQEEKEVLLNYADGKVNYYKNIRDKISFSIGSSLFFSFQQQFHI